MIDILLGSNPILWFWILVAALFLRFAVVPLVEWLLDLGERRLARDVYHQRAEDERRTLNGIVSVSEPRRRS